MRGPDFASGSGLCPAFTGHSDTVSSAGPVDEAGTVETLGGRSAAVAVGFAYLTACRRCDSRTSRMIGWAGRQTSAAGGQQDEEHPYAFVTLVERGGFGITAAGGVTGEVLQWAVENLES